MSDFSSFIQTSTSSQVSSILIRVLIEWLGSTVKFALIWFSEVWTSVEGGLRVDPGLRSRTSVRPSGLEIDSVSLPRLVHEDLSKKRILGHVFDPHAVGRSFSNF